MPYGFLDVASTPGVRAAQEANGSGEFWTNFKGDRPSDRFTVAEAAFIAERDSLYMATVSESGWPYVQHRGGPPGFIRVLDEKTLAIPDFRGNRQYISTGNLAGNDHAALILMDYPNRRRLKLYAHVEARDLEKDPELARKSSAASSCISWRSTGIARSISFRDSAEPNSLRRLRRCVRGLERWKLKIRRCARSLPHKKHENGRPQRRRLDVGIVIVKTRAQRADVAI
jgi:predicted pyridoxine 5'-phosphate oxidase superfamily flavin-nucleotide-binding protein